jgi:hypothetical protein
MTTMEWLVPAAAVDQVALEAVERLRALGVTAPFLPFWLRATAEHVHPDDETRIVIEHDPATGLISFDAWVGQRRIFGADDFRG